MCIKMTKTELLHLVRDSKQLNYYRCKNCDYILLIPNTSDTVEWTCCRCGKYNTMEKIEIIEDVLPSG